MQSYLFSLLDELPFPYGIPNGRAYITPPGSPLQAKIPAIYIWPADGDENRSEQLGGTIPRNTGPGTASGTKGIMHRFDVYLTWFSSGAGPVAGPEIPRHGRRAHVRPADLPGEVRPGRPEHGAGKLDLQHRGS